MTYNKPEVVVLGEAAQVVQGPKPLGHVTDGPVKILPAYDLDE